MGTSAIFALDIGTRKIAGLMLEKVDSQFRITAAAVREQLPGAMQDGQIHHIQRVSQVIQAVKEEIEQQTGTTLHSAAVAAAGRALLTHKGRAKQELGFQAITAEQVTNLELSAVQNALTELSAQNRNYATESYLCVGYSVTRYYLDRQPIGALFGHQGREMQAEVIATFLPRVVVDSLRKSLELSGLTMESLTLEPIAAIHTVIPESMRMLNIALVDIGAGTSDIAISADGTVTAYGMVASAGDKITRFLAENLLLDFLVAESLKRQLNQENETIAATDVLGNTNAFPRQELLQLIRPVTEKLVAAISQEILALNEGRAPKGVVLVGGGSLTPDLAPLLAQSLQLPEHLVRIRERASLPQITGGEDTIFGPQAVTPVAIGVTHLDGLAMGLQKVEINGMAIQFLRFPKTTVGEALLHSGLTVRHFMGRPGRAVSVQIEGTTRTFPGSLGKPAEITLNGRPATVDTPLDAEENRIKITSPQDGQDACVTLGEVAQTLQNERSSLTVTINGRQQQLQPVLLVNGEKRPPEYVLQDRDRVTRQYLDTIGDVLRAAGYRIGKTLTLEVNGQRRQFAADIIIRCNGQPASLDTPVQAGDHIEYHAAPVTPGDLIETAQKDTAGITVKVNGHAVRIEQPGLRPLRVNGQVAQWEQSLADGDIVEYDEAPSAEFILTDLFRALPQEMLPRNRRLQFRVNGEAVGYTHIIHDGDEIEIKRDC